MERKHNLFFCTSCGYKLTGEEYICPGCGFKIAEAPAPVTPAEPKVDNPPVKETIKKEEKSPEPKTVSKPSAPVNVKPLKKNKGIGIVWLIVIIFFGIVIIGLGTVAFLQYNGNIDIAILRKYIPVKSSTQTATTDEKNTTTKPVTNNNQVNTQNPDTASSHQNNNPDQMNANNNQNQQSSNTNSSSFKFFIIAGSYSAMDAAQQAVGNLKAKGYSGAQVVGKSENGNWRICYKAYSTRHEAIQDLDNIKQKENPTAWIFEQK